MLEDIRPPFSPFTPTTFDVVRDEIKRNSENLEGLEQVISPQVQSDVKEKLLKEKTYLVTQQSYHLEAIAQQAIPVELNDVDADELLKGIKELNNNVQQLNKQAESIKDRSLEDQNRSN